MSPSDSFNGGENASKGVKGSSGGGRRGSRPEGGDSEVAGNELTVEMKQVVFLRWSCRYNSDLARASMTK